MRALEDLNKPTPETVEAKNQRRLWEAIDNVLDLEDGIGGRWNALQQLEKLRSELKPRWL